MGETFQTVIVWLILSPTSLICRSAHLPAGPACVRCPVGQGQAGLWAASAAPLHPMHILMFSQSLTLLMGTSHVSFLLHHCAPCSQVQGTSAHPWLGAWLLSRLLAGWGLCPGKADCGKAGAGILGLLAWCRRGSVAYAVHCSDAGPCPWAVCHRGLFNFLCHNISQSLICLSS